MDKVFYVESDDGIDQTCRGIARIPIEVLLRANDVRGCKLHIWLRQGDGFDIDKKELLSYVKASREWADVMEKVASKMG